MLLVVAVFVLPSLFRWAFGSSFWLLATCLTSCRSVFTTVTRAAPLTILEVWACSHVAILRRAEMWVHHGRRSVWNWIRTYLWRCKEESWFESFLFTWSALIVKAPAWLFFGTSCTNLLLLLLDESADVVLVNLQVADVVFCGVAVLGCLAIFLVRLGVVLKIQRT